MAFSTFSLEFMDGEGSRVRDTPTARIRVETGTGFGALQLPIITADCKSKEEIDFQIDRLVGELENIRRQAHQKFT